jgi:hypothetical protein
MFSSLILFAFIFDEVKGQAAISPKNIVKTKNSEEFAYTFQASNVDRRHPLEYSFSNPIKTNWQLTIQNNLSYYNSNDSKTVIRLKEPPPSEKFIELVMFSENTKKFWAAVNTNESGYIKVYERDSDGWSREEPIFVSHANNQGLTITNGKRIIVDKLSINDFTIGSISIYGKDSANDSNTTYSGEISFSLIFGNPSDSPLYYLPLIMLVGIGGTLVILLIVKKRDKVSD